MDLIICSGLFSNILNKIRKNLAGMVPTGFKINPESLGPGFQCNIYSTPVTDLSGLVSRTFNICRTQNLDTQRARSRFGRRSQDLSFTPPKCRRQPSWTFLRGRKRMQTVGRQNWVSWSAVGHRRLGRPVVDVVGLRVPCLKSSRT